MEPSRLRSKSTVIQRLAAVLVTFSAMLLSACGEEKAEDAQVVRPVRAVKVGEVAALTRGMLPGRAKATRT